jgi:hypothetical protein
MTRFDVIGATRSTDSVIYAPQPTAQNRTRGVVAPRPSQTASSGFQMDSRAVGLREMHLPLAAATEVRRLLADPSAPTHRGTPVPVADAARLQRALR